MSVFGLHGLASGWLAAWVALLVAVGGQWAARRWRWALPAVFAGACLAGWLMLMPSGWPEVLWPRGALEHVALPAAILAGAGLLEARVRTRWLGVAVAVCAAWWMAGTDTARSEFWRVWFAGIGVVWALTAAGAGEPSRGLSVALTMLGGMVLGGAGWLWIGTASVLAAAALGMAGGGGKGATIVPPALLMVGLVAGELGAGRLIRGGVGLIDLTLIGAMSAPLAVPWAERAVGRRSKRLSSFLGPLLAAAGVVGAAWVTFRVWRSYQS